MIWQLILVFGLLFIAIDYGYTKYKYRNIQGDEENLTAPMTMVFLSAPDNSYLGLLYKHAMEARLKSGIDAVYGQSLEHRLYTVYENGDRLIWQDTKYNGECDLTPYKGAVYLFVDEKLDDKDICAIIKKMKLTNEVIQFGVVNEKGV